MKEAIRYLNNSKEILNPTSCLFAILGIKYGHILIVTHVISIG